MTDKDMIDEALDFIVNVKNLCAVEEDKDSKYIDREGICYCFDSCTECWREYFKSGAWWFEEHEPDPDRAWKEMHETD